jgi:hypothetical protein
MRDRSVLRNITQFLGVSTDILTVKNFNYHFNRILFGTGFYRNITIYSIRRAIANAVNSTFAFHISLPRR